MYQIANNFSNSKSRNLNSLSLYIKLIFIAIVEKARKYASEGKKNITLFIFLIFSI